MVVIGIQVASGLDGAIPVVPAATKEAVGHHAVGKQEKQEEQDRHQHNLPDSIGKPLDPESPTYRSHCIRIPPLCH
jgi:hypothetical protein